MSTSFRSASFHIASAFSVLTLLAATLVASPAEAQQVRRRGGDGAGVAAGIIGGLAAGALVGGALGGSRYVDPGYGEGFEGPEGEGCPLVRQPVYDGAGRFAGYRALPSC